MDTGGGSRRDAAERGTTGTTDLQADSWGQVSDRRINSQLGHPE